MPAWCLYLSEWVPAASGEASVYLPQIHLTMAKQKGLLKLTGSFGDLSFYHSKRGGYLVRQKGGPSKRQIKQGATFERTRENISEFGAASRAGKYLRGPLRPLLKDVSDGMLAPRMLALFQLIQTYDDTNLRGQRRTGPALAHPEARKLLQDFAFNEQAPLGRILHVPVTNDLSAETVSISGLVPQKMLSFPAPATHVRFQAVRLRVHFETGDWKVTTSDAVMTALSETVINVTLSAEDPGAVPGGWELTVLQVTFLQEVNGEMRVLLEGNGLGVVGIGNER
jgi:hypothetical protein